MPPRLIVSDLTDEQFREYASQRARELEMDRYVEMILELPEEELA